MKIAMSRETLAGILEEWLEDQGHAPVGELQLSVDKAVSELYIEFNNADESMIPQLSVNGTYKDTRTLEHVKAESKGLSWYTGRPIVAVHSLDDARAVTSSTTYTVEDFERLFTKVDTATE